jgi:hypothetical protein
MIMSDYNYERYEMILLAMLNSMWRDPDELEIGENISELPEVKIIFDGFGDLEDEDENGEYRYTEGGNTDMESYAIFIHKDALTENFEFPEHEMTFWALIHRPKEEVCVYAWYDVANDEWEILSLEERIDDDCAMSEQDVMVILEGLYKKYFNESDEYEISTD